jgi:hypothetical protein
MAEDRRQGTSERSLSPAIRNPMKAQRRRRRMQLYRLCAGFSSV